MPHPCNGSLIEIDAFDVRVVLVGDEHEMIEYGQTVGLVEFR